MKKLDGQKSVLIGIQARSTSKRFPRKIFEKIGNRTMLHHVIGQVKKSSKYLTQNILNKFDVSVCLLVPEGDEVLNRAASYDVDIIQGSEFDVLSRYVTAANQKNADYIVRITADCPLIPPFLISKHVLIAVENGYDYLANVYENFRTAPDGFDCEIMSRQMLNYLDQNAVTKEDREHVTLMARRETPRAFKFGCVIGFMHLSDIKLSVDTPEDLERVRNQFTKIDQCNKEAHAQFGQYNIHRV